MQSHSKSAIVQPRVIQSLLVANVEPKSVKIALQDTKWFGAMQDEFLALQWNKTWSLVVLSLNFHTIGCKWCFVLRKTQMGLFINIKLD